MSIALRDVGKWFGGFQFGALSPVGIFAGSPQQPQREGVTYPEMDWAVSSADGYHF